MKPPKIATRWRWHAALGAVLTAAAILTAGHAPASSGPAVDIKDFTYTPTMLTVPVGATVTWTNHDEESHTVTSATSAFTSRGLSHEETFARTFGRPGTYTYFCALHPHMKATVVVK
jgi:plastocyanin